MKLNGYIGTIGEKDGFLYREGKTDYQILLPAAATECERFAAQELTDIFSKAGVKIGTRCDEGLTADPEAKYIAVGDTVYFRSLNMTLTQQEFKFDGFILETVGNTHVIKGVGDSGTCFGVYGFCEYACGYVFYTRDVQKIQKEAQNKCFHIKDIPTFVGRRAYSRNTNRDPDYGFRLRNNGEFSRYTEKHGNGSPWATLDDQSNALMIMDYRVYREKHPDWYYVKPEYADQPAPRCYPQLCYSKAMTPDAEGGFFDTFVKNLLENYIIPEKDKMFFMLGMSDNRSVCDCPACQALNKTYTVSGTSMLFANKVADAVEAWRKEYAPQRQIYLVTFAYLSTFDPPVVEKDGMYLPVDEAVIARDNVIVQNAPINATYLYPILDPEHNAASRASILGWKTVAKHMFIWDYRQDFHDNTFPYPFSQTAQCNLETYRDLGVMEVLNQTTSLCVGPPFVEMDDFARARLLWNLKEDYYELIREFMQAVYEDAAPVIWEYLQAVEAYHKVMESRGWTMTTHNGALRRPYLHTMEELYAFKEILDRAMALAKTPRVRRRIEYLTLFWQVTLLAGFSGELPKEEALALLQNVREIAGKNELTLMGNKRPMKEMLDEWEAFIKGEITDEDRKFPITRVRPE